MNKIFSLLLLLFAVVGVGLGAVKSAQAQVYIYANDGSYYTRYGPSAYWWKTTGQGYCGNYGTCSPNNMEYTYSNSCTLSNHVKWDNVDYYLNGVHKVFIPGVNATSRRAPYSLVYDAASRYSWNIDQYVYYNVWIQTGTFYDIRNTRLSDSSCEAVGSKKIGFDEIYIAY